MFNDILKLLLNKNFWKCGLWIISSQALATPQNYVKMLDTVQCLVYIWYTVPFSITSACT
jgi:hypothetical protein